MVLHNHTYTTNSSSVTISCDYDLQLTYFTCLDGAQNNLKSHCIPSTITMKSRKELRPSVGTTTEKKTRSTEQQ